MGGFFSNGKGKGKVYEIAKVPQVKSALVGVATEKDQLMALFKQAQYLHSEHQEQEIRDVFREIGAFTTEAQEQGSTAAMITYLKKNAAKLQGFQTKVDAIQRSVDAKLDAAAKEKLASELAADKARIDKESVQQLVLELGRYEDWTMTATHLKVRDKAKTEKTYAVGDTVKIEGPAPLSFVFKGKGGARTILTDTGNVDTFTLTKSLMTGTIGTSAHDAYSNLYDGYAAAAYDQHGYRYDDDAGDVFAGYSRQNALVSQGGLGSAYHYQDNLGGVGVVGYDGFAFGVVALAMVLVVCLMTALCFVFGAVFGFLGKVIMDKSKVNGAGNEAEKRRNIGDSVL